MRRLVVACAVAALGCAGAQLKPASNAVVHSVTTPDGWSVQIVEYPAKDAPQGLPVLVSHGFFTNDRMMDLDDAHSIVRWLSAQGRPAWLMALRGGGGSDRIDRAQGRGPYNFDTLWRQDLTSAIAYVRERSGGGSIDYIGHSMGGMLGYAYLSQGGQGLNAVVTLASPTRFDWGGLHATLLERVTRLVIRPDTVLPVTTASSLSAPFLPALERNPLQRLIFNPKNLSQETLRALARGGSADASGALILQMLDMYRSGRFASADGKIDYRRDMATIRTPVLVVAGKCDRVAYVPSVKDGYRALGGPKEWLIVGEENGAAADYGHADYLLGERAAEEVWAQALDFLDRHAPATKAE